VGIGVELTMKNDMPVITRVLPDSPAQQAGLMIGDQLITIDELPTASMSFGEIVMHIRGKPGSQLSLKAIRGTQTIWVVLPRGSLKKQGDGYNSKALE
jgi:C-terminal processing protease CtpA/Prc